MRNKYNMQLNPRRLSREDIEKHKDFDALLEEFQQSQPPRRALRRRLWYLSGAVAAAAAGLLFYFAAGPSPLDQDPVPTPEAYFAQQEFVEPPLETVQPEYATHSVDARQGGTYAFSGGSRLVIPSKAFMDDRGRLIEGDVDIHYREMHDYVDFFVAGIPMVYDSAGARFFLESAGMVEIFAVQDGERLRLAPGKAIEVELVSEIVLPPDVDAAPAFRVYQLDTLNRTWTYRPVEHEQVLEAPSVDPNDPLYWAKTALLEELTAIEAGAEAQRRQIRQSLARPVAPVKPQPLSSDQPSLELDFLDGVEIEGQDRRFYEGTIWQISPNSPDFDPDVLSEVWADFQFRPVNNVEYELTLLRGEEQEKILVTPVLSGDDYQRARQAYEEAYARYEAQLAEYEAAINRRLDSLQTTTDAAILTAREQFESQVKTLQDEGQFVETGIRRRIVNRFLASSLGIWSCDRLLPVGGETFRATFVDQHGKEYRSHTAYLATKGHNTVFRFFTGESGALQIDLDAESLLWVVTEDNKIALLRPRRLREDLSGRKEAPLLELELIDQEIRTEEDVREILRL